LSALIRFGLNDFSRWREASGFRDLDHAYSILGPLGQDDQTPAVSRSPLEKANSARVFVCPVDLGTDTVTRLAKQATELLRWGSAAEKQFCTLADQASADSFDRAKIRALWAVTAIRLGAAKSAEHATRLLDGDPTFGDWANRNLAKVEL
jgi:hypothetical protein